ncbi:unnamed protein product [Linum tenue]|uniref:Uncharacterized protein n=1 Tax=Linum tenue TaxID=586396 RepID=A0AAV0HIP6_9ROSI|nr:unnamed protein product [Linum tenue]
MRGASPGGASSAALNKAKASGVGSHFESRSGGSSGTANLKGENATGSSSEHHVKAAAIAAHNYRPGGGAYAEFLNDKEVLEKCLSMWEHPDRTSCQNRASTLMKHLEDNAKGMTINAEPAFVPTSNRKKIQSSFWEELLEKCVKEHGSFTQKCDIQRQRVYECFGSYYDGGIIA